MKKLIYANSEKFYPNNNKDIVLEKMGMEPILTKKHNPGMKIKAEAIFTRI